MADNFNHNLEVLNRNIELLAQKMGGSDTFDSGSIAHLGNFVQSLSDLKSLGKGEILNTKAVEQQIHSSLMGLQSSITGDTKQIVQNIQSQMSQIFSATTDDFGKHLTHIGNGISTLEKSYSTQIVNMQRNGVNVVRTHIDQGIRDFNRNIAQTNQAYMDTMQNGLIALSGRVAQQRNSMKGASLDFTLSVDSIMKDMEASSSRSISSRKAALKRIASEYRAAGHIQDDVFQSLTTSIGAIKGSDKAYRAESSLSAKPITDQFRGVVQNLFDSLSTESRNYIGKNRGQQVTRGIASYGTDGFYGGSTATLRQQVLGSSKELSDFLSGKYLSQRIANVGGNQSAIKNRFDLNAQFDSVMKTFEKMGIGTYWKPSASGKTMDIGFFDESKIDQIFSQRGKSVQADWSKMAKITMGIPGQHGNVVAGGMNLADVFLPMLSTKNGLPSATMSTLSEQIWQSVFGGLDSKKFLQHLKSGDITKATSYLSRLQSNVIEGMATNATYGAYSSDSIADITKGMYAGSSPMRRLYRSNTAKFANSLESAYNAFYKPTSGKSMSSSQLEQMMDYVFARFTGDAQANMILGDKDHKWITTAGGTRYLDTLADLLKTAFPNAGISSKKELAYLTGDIAAVDSNALSPFHVLNPGMNRGISQGANNVRRAHQAKGLLRSPLLRSQMAVNLGENYDSLERQIVTMAEATDSEIRGGLSQYYGKLAQEGNIHELTQLYGRHIGKVPKNLKGNATALATALSNRQMPSTLEGGAITSTDIAKSFEGYRDATATITYDDLMKLGLTQTPTEANSVLNLNQMDAQRLIGHSKHGVRLSDGTVLRGGYRGKGYRGDLPTSVSLMSDGSYQLAYQEFMPYNRFVKMVSTDGDRLTLNSSLTSGEMSALNQYLGISGKGADVFVEPTKTDPRKLAGLTQKKYEEVFQRINSGIQSGTIKSQDLSDFIQGDTTLSKFLSYDGKYLWSKVFNSSEFKSVFDGKEEGAQDLFNTYSQTGAYARLIQRFLPKQFNELMGRNIGATSLNKADEYEYFDPIGSVSKEVAQRSGHYKQTPLERQSIAREIGMMSAMGINTDALSSVLTSYGSLGESSELALNKTAQSLREAYNKTIGRSAYSSEVNPASTIVNDLIYGKGGTLNQGDFATTILGNAYQNFLQNGNDTRLDLGRTFTIRGEKGGTLNLNSVAVPTLEPTLNTDGTYTPHALEGKYRALVKSLQALDEIEATSGDVDSIAREQAYGTAQAALEDVVASQYNTLYYKKGAIQSGLNNTQLTNATASKATAGNFSNPEVLARLSNSVVLSNADLTRMMSTGEGGDLNQNIQRLSWMAKRMFSGDESVLKKINTWTSQGTTDAEQSLIQQILTATDINNVNGQGLQGFFHRNPLIAGDDNKFINVRSSGVLGRGLMYADQGLATAVNLDYDGDTNYTALPLFGASNEAEFNAAADSFDKMQRVTARVNDILRENAYSDYSTKSKTGLIAEGSDVKMSEAISSFYANDGRDSFLQDILSKKNFKFVGQLDNYAKAMYSAYSSNMMDELSGDPTKAGRSILARSFFEQLTQDSISSKKVGERIRSKIGKGATDAQIEALYLQELQGLQSTIDLAKSMGRNSVSATDLVNGVSNSGVLDFSKGNRVTHRALATVESMLREVYGNDSQAYRAKMEELGIWDSRFDRAYGLRDGEEDTTASQRGVISSQQYAKILEARNAEFAAIHPGQSIVSEGYAQLSKGGQYEKTADQIVDNLRARVRKAEQITEQFTGSPVGATNGANIGRTLGIRELVAMNNPKAGFSDYSAATSKLIDGRGNLGNSEFLSQMMSADSDTARASLMGFSNTRDFNAFKQYLVKKVIGDTVHKAHETGSVTDNNYYRSLFGTGSFTDDGQGIGLFKALGLSQTEIDNLHSGIAYRYGAQSEVNRKINADMSEGSITSLQEAGIKANIGGIDLKGISDLITFGQVGDKKVARITDYKNIGHDPGIREFEQLFLNEAVLRQMQKDIIGEKMSDADAAKRYGWTPEAIAQLRQVEDFESILNATDNKGNTKAYRRTNAWVADEAVEQIAKAGKTGILTADQRESIMSMYSASPLDSVMAEQGEQGAQMARKYGQHLTNDEMLSQYRAFMGEKLAIDQNYATVKAQLSGTAERDPEYKVLQKRLESLQALREEYSSINYYRDGDNLVRAKGENIDAWTEGFDNGKPREIIQQFEQLNQGAEVHNKTMMQMSNINNRVTKTLAGLSSQFKGMLSYYAMYGVVQKIIGSVMQTFQKFIQTVKELDQALVNLEIVTTKSRNELQESIEGYMDIAHNMGRTTTEVMSAANDWLRAGYDIEDANLLIQDSLKLSTLGMIDAEKATESLLSTMKGWKLTAEEVSGVVDSLTALDVEYATTAGDIATAMAKGNVSASLAGVDMSNYQAYLTTVLDVSQQSAETVGTAFKTLFARYGNVKAGKYAENYNFGESDSEANDETTKLNDVETVLNKVGIQTRATVGEFREMDKVLDEVAEKWSSFDKVTKNAITTAMAGKIVARTYSNVWLSGI